MDLFHDNPLFQGVRQMLGAFAKQQIRPIAIEARREESMPWELMKSAQALRHDADRAARRPQEADRRRRGSRSEEAEEPGAPRGRGVRGARVGLRRHRARARRLGPRVLAGRADGHRRAEGRVQEAAAGHRREGPRPASPRWRCRSPATGSDISGLKTTARADGDHWIIRGSKQWITNGQSARVYVVWAQTDASAGRAGVRGFIVARGTPGLVPGKKETKLGIRASETAQVHFEDVRVHKDMMLGVAPASRAGGLADTKKMLDSTRPGGRLRRPSASRAPRTSSCSSACAAARCTARRWRATSTSCSSSPRCRWRSRRRACSRTAPRGWPIITSRTSPRRRWRRRTARAPRSTVTTRAMVLLGEEALEPGHPVEKWYRDAKIYDIFEGTGQIQRRIIAKQLTGQNPT